MIDIGCANGFLKIGTILWKVEGGSGGLGVHALVPGLVKPPSLVSSAVDALLLLQVDAQDMPRRKVVDSADSSIGELVAGCSGMSGLCSYAPVPVVPPQDS